MKLSTIARAAAVAALTLGGGALVATPSQASPAGDDVVINEVYPNGGSGGGLYRSRYFELYNPTSGPIDVDGWSLQGRSAAGTGSFNTVAPLGDTTIAAGGYLLVAGPGNAANAQDIPTADVTGPVNVSASGGQVALSRSTTLLTGDRATLLADTDLVDLVGYGASTVGYEGDGTAPLGGPSASISRAADHDDTDDNADDFVSLSPPTPCNSAGCGVVVEPDPPVDATIAEVQGAGFTSPLAGSDVTVEGIVTATYTTGLFNGAYLQTDGTGDVDPADHAASDGVFVSSAAFAADVEKGDFVEVTGRVSESFGLTQIATPTDGWTVINDEPHDGVTPATVTFPMSSATRESFEGMLLDVTGDFTVTNNYTTDRYGDIGLVDGDEPLATPTNVVEPGPAAEALQADNDARLITLDDGSDVDRFSADKNIPLPWLTPDNEVRVGAAATITDPVILDYRRSLWRLQPTERMEAGEETATFSSTRAAAPEPVGGGVTIGTFNVLNYFTTTGAEYDAGAGNACTYFDDRAGNHITADGCGSPTADSGNGPRGAADDANLARQQAKIVHAINTLDADVVSLEEIENSIAFGPDRDAALSTLVDALNEDAGEDRWAYVASPAEVPSGEDVIRTAFIYQPSAVVTVGDPEILIGASAFDNAREPLAQAFKVAGGSDASTFAVIVNHFKSKSSGSGQDADAGDGQGGSNYSRTQQAAALVDFADEFAESTGTEKVFLTGDFNAYNKEDPVGIIEDAGYVNVPAKLTDKETYQFDGQIGSLDHVFASDVAFDAVTGADIWNINSYESPGREYSRFNYNATNLYDASPFRASDHDPELIGFDAEPVPSTTTAKAPSSVRAGEDLTVKASVDSTGAQPTGDVTVTEDGSGVGAGTLVDGAVEVPVEGLGIGSHTLTVTYGGDPNHAPSSTSVVVSVLKAEAVLEAEPVTSTYGTSGVLHVAGAPGASGLVYVALGDELVGMGSLSDGAADITLSSTIPVGTQDLTVFYGGNASYDPATASTSIVVAKAPTVTRKVSVSPTTVVKNRTKPYVSLTVTAPGFAVDGGTVTLRQSGRSYRGTVVDGRVRIRLGVFTSSGPAKKVTATYAGNGVALGSTTSFTVKVLAR